MTIVAPAGASQPAPAAAAPLLSGLADGHAFSAALDAVLKGDGKRSPPNDERKSAPDEARDPPPRSTVDLRAALVEGALASMTAALTVEFAATAARDENCGDSTGSPALSSAALSTPPPEAAKAAAAKATAISAKAGSAAKLTAERTYLAPPAFAVFAGEQPAAALAAKGGAADALPQVASFAPVPSPTAAVAAQSVSDPSRRSQVSPPVAPWLSSPVATGAGIAEASSTGEPAAGGNRTEVHVTSAPVARGNFPSSIDSAVPPTAAPSGRLSVEGPVPASRGAQTEPPRPAVAPAASSRPPASRRDIESEGPARRVAAGVTPRTASDAAKASDGSASDSQASSGALPSAPTFEAAIVPADLSVAVADPRQAASTLREASRLPDPSPRTSPPALAAQPAARVREIDLDLAPSGLEDVRMTVRLAGDKVGVVIRAASGATATAIEGARDAIAEKLAAIGQPLSSLVIQQTGVHDAKGAAGQSASDNEAPPDRHGEMGDPRGGRRRASR